MIRARGKRPSFPSQGSYAWAWEVGYPRVVILVGVREAVWYGGPGCGKQVAERVMATMRVHCLASAETHLVLLGNARGV